MQFKTIMNLHTDSPVHDNHSGFTHGIILCVLGLVAFFYNLQTSLFGVTEGLYAAVTETMVRTGEYVHLTLHGQPYWNKPPLFFWLQAVSTHFLGWHELALRLPSALLSFGTVIVTYWLGRTMYSHTAGFIAAIVIVTSYASLWFGQMAIIDPVLTFFMTFGIFGLIRAYFRKGTQWWYVMGFAALAIGSMVKNLHAFALPMLLFLALLWVCRDTAPFKRHHFWLGLCTFVGLLGLYYAYLGQEFVQHYVLKENLQRMTKLAGDTQGTAFDAYFGKRPIVWYVVVVWFDFFPWSALLPTAIVVLWKERPRGNHPKETFLLFWVLGYFLAFSVFPEKHERYLMPMVPGVAVLIGYVYHRVFEVQDLEVGASKFYKVMLGLLSLVFIILVFLAPFLLQKKWNLTTDVFPLGYQLLMTLGIGTLVYAVLNTREKVALKMVGVLAVGLMIAVVVFIVPGINAVASPKMILTEVQSVLKHPHDPIANLSALELAE